MRPGATGGTVGCKQRPAVAVHLTKLGALEERREAKLLKLLGMYLFSPSEAVDAAGRVVGVTVAVEASEGVFGGAVVAVVEDSTFVCGGRGDSRDDVAGWDTEKPTVLVPGSVNVWVIVNS